MSEESSQQQIAARSALALRHASIEDAPALAAFAARAFTETYRDLDDAKDIAEYVDAHFNVPAVSAVVRDPACITLLAEIDERLAGYAVLKSAQPPNCSVGPSPIELARFYIDQEFIGKGYGAQLMLAAHAEARRLGAKTLWLGVYERNVRAVRFYERFGFRKAGGKEFLFGGRIYVDPIYCAPVRGGIQPFRLEP